MAKAKNKVAAERVVMEHKRHFSRVLAKAFAIAFQKSERLEPNACHPLAPNVDELGNRSVLVRG